jgi:hypothetical protein
VLFYSLPFFLSAGIFGGSTAKNKKKHLCVLRISVCPTCPVKCLPNEMFTQGQFNRDEIPVALISSGR